MLDVNQFMQFIRPIVRPIQLQGFSKTERLKCDTVENARFCSAEIAVNAAQHFYKHIGIGFQASRQNLIFKQFGVLPKPDKFSSEIYNIFTKDFFPIA